MTGAAARRWAALLIFVALPLALALLSAANILQALDARALADATEAQVARYRERLNRRGAATPLDAPDLSAIFVKAGSRSLAEAELQRRIVASIEGAAARVVESGSGEVPGEEGEDVVEVRATLDTDNRGLLRLLHGIETGLPLMFVDEIAARRLDGEETGGEKGGDPRLRVEMRVRARWRSLEP